MTDEIFTAFRGPHRLAQGTRAALSAELAPLGPHPEGLLVFSDRTGRQTDLDLTGLDARPRGRPKLGVKAREVTLLPRHWDWLARQRGGASASLRRLIEAAIAGEDPREAGTDAAYRFLTAIAGDLPGYEAAIRALYAGDSAGFAAALAPWPGDIANHALGLARLP
jgi:uncharacterized protein